MITGYITGYIHPQVLNWARILIQVTTNQKPTIYRNLYENTAPADYIIGLSI